MSHFQTHRLCNKLYKWINNSFTQHNHSKNSQTEGTHLHYNSKNTKIFCSPYKKTSFETLLRKYPKNEQEIRNLPKSNSQRQNQQNYGMKRTFQSRMMNFQNVKSKIDTNLNGLKQFRMKQQNIHCPNDQNKNVMNNNLVQQLNDKEMIQNNLMKKIKLNTGQYESYQVKKSNVWVKNDQNNQLLMNRNLQGEGIKIKGQKDCNKGLFKINVSKKINMFGMNNFREENNLSIIDGEKKQAPGQQAEEINCQHDNAEEVRLQQILIDEKQFIKERQNEVSQAFIGQPLLLSSGDTRLVFKELKGENGEHLQSEDEAEDGIFCFNGYRMTESRDHQQQEEQINLINNCYESQAIHADEHQQMPMETRQIPLQISTDEIIQQRNSLEHSLQEIQPVTESNNQIIPVSDTQITMLQALKLLQDIQYTQNYINHQQYVQIIQQPHAQNIPQELNNLSFNHTHIQVQHKEIPLTFRPKFQKPKREKKSKDNTKILTRSKEDKLLLFNKLSMRLIRKKYGQDLTHSELVEKLLQDQGKIHLKAFIQDHQRKTVFEFNQLTETQMKTILMKYFLQEESKNEQTE